MDIIEFNQVDVIFGPTPEKAAQMLGTGATKEEILARTENVVAVRNATLSVTEGEICVLMGLSGSGKSSLLRCVNGLNKVSRGEVLIRDKQDNKMINLATCDRATLHRLRTERIAMVFQQFALMPWRTVRENVALGLELSGVSRTQQQEIVNEKLALVRLEEWADTYPRELSGGMQQRVGLARALATDADILLMDEPFSALDPLIREHLQDELLQLQRTLKKTIVFVSHDPDEALKLGNQVGIMEDGQIIQVDTPERILSRPANEYVRRFVGSMNPLKVLHCKSLMQPVDEMPRAGDRGRWMDKKFCCRLDEQGRPVQVTRQETPVAMVPFASGMDLDAVPDTSLVSVRPDTPMRAAVEIHHRRGLPLPVIDTAGILVGTVGSREILGGILGQ